MQPTKLPPLDKERSVRLWNEWGREPRRVIDAKVYEQSSARAEPAEAPVVKAGRKKAVRRK